MSDTGQWCKSCLRKHETKLDAKMCGCPLAEDVPPVCDFCTCAVGPFATFHCDPSVNDTLAPLVYIQDDGRWAACPGCTPLVRAGDLDGTVARALAGFPEEMKEFGKLALRDLHGRFFRHKAGIQN